MYNVHKRLRQRISQKPCKQETQYRQRCEVVTSGDVETTRQEAEEYLNEKRLAAHTAMGRRGGCISYSEERVWS